MHSINVLKNHQRVATRGYNGYEREEKDSSSFKTPLLVFGGVLLACGLIGFLLFCAIMISLGVLVLGLTLAFV